MRSSSGSGSGSGSGSSSNAWRATAAAPLSRYEFDFGNLSGSGGGSSIGGGRSTLKQQPAPTNPTQNPTNQKWTHRPSTGLTGTPTPSMVGDITGRSWIPLNNSSSNSSSSGIVGGVGSSKVDLFSDLLNTSISKSNNATAAFPVKKGAPMNSIKVKNHKEDDLFGEFASVAPATHVPSSSNGFQSAPPPPPPPPPSSSIEDLLQKISVSTKPQAQSSVHQSSNYNSGIGGLDEWNQEFVDSSSKDTTTTELEDLPPPPAGVTGVAARDKGVEFQKQGQFADAIKWLTWAVMLLEKSTSDTSVLLNVLTCRVSCYKEVGDYKKAVDDCCKVLEMDGSDTEVLVQRAFLYESMEKYKLSVQDLREALKRDPSNRLARNTLARLAKMVD